MGSLSHTVTPTNHSSSKTDFRPLLMVLAIIFAAATVAYSAGWMYYVREAIKVEIGIDTNPVASGLQVRDVWRGSPAERAGLRTNDVITAINARSVNTPTGPDVLNQIWYQSRPGETVDLTIERPGQEQPVLIRPTFRGVQGTGDTASLAKRGAIEILSFYPLLFLAVGLPVLFLRPQDRNAWLLALVFAGFIAESPAPTAFAFAPDWFRQFLLAYFMVYKSLLPPLFYFFFVMFPVRSPIDRKLSWWDPAAGGGVVRVVGSPGRPGAAVAAGASPLGAY